MKKGKKWLFKKPQGPAKRKYSSHGTVGEIVCDGCGTIHPELNQNEVSRGYLVMCDYQIVEECCGAVLDRLYDFFGEMFFEMWSDEFQKDPLAKKHIYTRTCVECMIRAWNKVATKENIESETILAQLPLS